MNKLASTLFVFSLVLFSAASYADELQVPESLSISTQVMGQSLTSGKISWRQDSLERISAENGFEFTCYCYMNGSRVPVMKAEGVEDLKDADSKCKKLEGGVYEDFGVINGTGKRVYTIVRSCAGSATMK